VAPVPLLLADETVLVPPLELPPVAATQTFSLLHVAPDWHDPLAPQK
jgi:hypothetical protein